MPLSFIITGDENATTQYNFYNKTLDMGDNWVAYHAGEEKPYNCGSCHTLDRAGTDGVGHMCHPRFWAFVQQ